jgi:hypothetical protein
MRMKISRIRPGWVSTIVRRGLNELGNEVKSHDIVNKDLPARKNAGKEFGVCMNNDKMKEKSGVRE